jgi:hypothetical protein
VVWGSKVSGEWGNGVVKWGGSRGVAMGREGSRICMPLQAQALCYTSHSRNACICTHRSVASAAMLEDSVDFVEDYEMKITVCAVCAMVILGSLEYVAQIGLRLTCTQTGE